MRCSTPGMRVSESGLMIHSPPAFSTNGNQYIMHPMKKIRKERRRVFFQKAVLPRAAYFSITNAMALPTAKRKEGKTRSVGVKPCHGACANGAYRWLQLPGELTIIMKHIVIPR